jgi:hypothetical protein
MSPRNAKRVWLALAACMVTALSAVQSVRAQQLAYAAADDAYPDFVRQPHETTNHFSLHMMVPVWLSEAGIDPGFGMEARLGWELGGFTPEIYGGAMVNWVDMWSGPSEPLDSFWFGFGARYHLFNPSAFVPFVGVGAQANFWNAILEADDWIYDDRRRPTIGFRGTLGAAIEVSANFALELGVHGVVGLPGSVFDRRPIYVTPFAGGTFYF